MARRALKGTNWSAIVERITEHDKTMFAAFKSRSEQYLRRVTELPEALPKIDWATYKKQVPVAGMVDRFQKEYESIKVPYPADTYTTILEAQEKAVAEDIKNFIEESNKRIIEYSAEAERIRGLLPFDQMTLEDYAEAYPDDALNIDKPTLWPHIPEDQPGDEPFEMPKPEEDH